MQYRSLAFCVFVLAVAAPFAPGHAQQQNQQTGEVRDCEVPEDAPTILGSADD